MSRIIEYTRCEYCHEVYKPTIENYGYCGDECRTNHSMNPSTAHGTIEDVMAKVSDYVQQFPYEFEISAERGKVSIKVRD